MSGVPSPCVQVCTLDPATEVCRGCFRTLEEIANWPSYTEAQKAEVWRRIAERRGAAPGSPAQAGRRP
ncbi:DUF1289 domain-containing protein [Pelomicrobium sp.]|jgi:predicted Fe-S protein YdhL (DUF1289 family)|uniref:DUF1289 domain-containing protein n=1 Tax=Pelomicrobium sp. TaxID=2815319 RepID=UPI002FDE1326